MPCWSDLGMTTTISLSLGFVPLRYIHVQGHFSHSTLSNTAKKYSEDPLVLTDFRLCSPILLWSHIFFILMANVRYNFANVTRSRATWGPGWRMGNPVRLSYSEAFIHTYNMTTRACLCYRGQIPLTFIFERCTLDRRCCVFAPSRKTLTDRRCLWKRIDLLQKKSVPNPVVGARQGSLKVERTCPVVPSKTTPSLFNKYLIGWLCVF